MDGLIQSRRWKERPGVVKGWRTPTYFGFQRHCWGQSADDRHFLNVHQSDRLANKNISYNASTGHLEGYASSGADSLRLTRVLNDYGESISHLAAYMLSSYGQHLQADLISFRPIEEEGRALPMLSRNDLIHIDAFPSRPARDRRILRFFTNLHLSKPRVWLTSGNFAQLADQMALDAGLEQCALDQMRCCDGPGNSCLQQQRRAGGQPMRIARAMTVLCCAFMII